MRSKVWLGTTVLLALTLAAVAHADTIVDDCAVLDVPGELYRLAADVAYGGADSCFHIAADGIVFDLQSHTVTGGFYPSGSGFQQGIRVTGHGTTVRNGFVVGFTGSFPFSAAVFVDGGTGATLSNLTLSDSLLGVLSYLAEGTRVEQSSVNGTASAVLLCPSDGVVLDNNRLRECTSNCVTGYDLYPIERRESWPGRRPIEPTSCSPRWSRERAPRRFSARAASSSS